jgi:hypothetical protein
MLIEEENQVSWQEIAEEMSESVFRPEKSH